MKGDYTPRQGQYLAFIYHYTKVHGRPPAQADIQYFFRVSPPTVHQKILDLEAKGLLARTPGEPRSLRVLLPPEELPELLPFSRPTDTRHPRSGGRRGIGKIVEVPSEGHPLDYLRDPEARAVLRAILDRHRELTGEAQALAQSVLKAVSSDDVADALENAVLEHTLEDLDRYPSSR